MSARKTAKQIFDEQIAKELEMLDRLHTSNDQMKGDKEIRYEAVCVTACTFRGQYWVEGRVYRGFVKPPDHFEIISSHSEITSSRTESQRSSRENITSPTEAVNDKGTGNDATRSGE
jgi:hypothetical protein